MSDLFGKIQEGRNFLEELVGKIPGFSGYQERSNRREADKLLREAIAERYGTQWSRVSQLQRELIEQGGQYMVPCLRIEKEDGTAQWLYESTDIIRYLTERFAAV